MTATVQSPGRTEVPLEPTTPIKPSEAIQLGRLMRPVHVRGTAFNAQGDGVCTIGAMFVGYGFDPKKMDDSVGWWDFLRLRAPLAEQFNYLTQIPGWYDKGLKSEAQIVAELEAMGV